MKTAMISLAAGLLCITACKAASTDTIAEVREKVVELHITIKDAPAASENKIRRKVENFAGKAVCSGSFVTRNGYILTAKHCTADAAGITVVTADLQEYRATIVAQSDTQDLAVIRIDRQNTPFFTLARSVEQGQAVHTYGSPLGITGTYTTGVIARLNGDVTYVDCGVLPGNSGGPAFNDDGEMVGVLTAGFIVMLGTTHLNVMQSLDSLLYFARTLAGGR